jgi:hypothetical protein
MKKIYHSLKIVVVLFSFTSVKLLSQCNVISNVPYLEDFQGITSNNSLPNCAWMASNIGNTCLTYTTGTKYAAFFNSPAGQNYFYTNGIQLKANIIYSVSVWYKTDNNGGQNWSDLSLFVCPSQTTTGAVLLASSNGAASSSNYISLSNTFTVATSGIYYMAMRGTGSGGSSPYLYWDDLRITIPCTGIAAPNSPTITINPGATSTICAGKSATLIANGANTYTWSNNATTSSIIVMPSVSLLNSVSGTNTLTGCTSSVNLALTVNPSPSLAILNSSIALCIGNTTSLVVAGASSYTWNNGSNSPTLSITPTISTTYSVEGENTFGCTSTKIIPVTVNLLPTVSVISSATALCLGESALLSAAGATTYQWFGASVTQSVGNQISVSPATAGSYTVIGTDANACSNSNALSLIVNACLGIKNLQSTKNSIIVYPNPSAGDFIIESHTRATKHINLVDLSGRIVFSAESDEEAVKINMEHVSAGVYYASIQTNGITEFIKVLKQ